MPVAISTDECVGKDNELAPNGGDGELAWPSGTDELVVVGLKVEAEAAHQDGRHDEACRRMARPPWMTALP